MLTKGQTISIGKIWPTASIFLVLMTSERNILFSFTFVDVGSYITDAQFYKNPREQADERTRCFKGIFLCWERLSRSIIGLQRIYHGTLQSWPSRPHSDQPADEIIQSSHNIIDLATIKAQDHVRVDIFRLVLVATKNVIEASIRINLFTDINAIVYWIQSRVNRQDWFIFDWSRFIKLLLV